MKRTGRTLVILTVGAWLATLSPALAGTGPAGAPAPMLGPAEDDPVRIGIGIGGDIIDVLSHDEDGDEDEGDDDGDGEGDLVGGLVTLLVGDGDSDDDENGDGLVVRLLEILFGEEDDSVEPAPVVPSAHLPALTSAAPMEDVAVQPDGPYLPADDDDGLLGELLGLDDDDDDGLLDDLIEIDDLDLDIDIEAVEDLIDILDDVAETVTDAVDAVVCVVVRNLDPTPAPPMPPPPCA
ncbi:MAG: hypothetical protein ACRDZ7_10985 [Acidimicrobiia bacterium]